jgi:glycosyltransferase involved in cell wall biosynthesis
VLFSAKLDRNKGGGVFLPAARRLAEAGAGVTVLGFGSSSRDHHAELARLDAAGATIVAERLPRSVFQRMLGEAAVVVGQFRVGALGMTELDALALQRPVVTGFRFPDAYKEPPPVVDASSAEQITDEVLGLLERHEDREALGLEGRRWVIRHHGTRRVAEQLIALYRESLAPNTRR